MVKSTKTKQDFKECESFPLRHFTSEKLQRDIMKIKKSIDSVEGSINNHDKELENKQNLLKAYKEELEKLELFQQNLSLVNV